MKNEVEILRDVLDDVSTQNWDLEEQNEYLRKEVARHKAELSDVRAAFAEETGYYEQKLREVVGNYETLRAERNELQKLYDVTKLELTKAKDGKTSDEHLARQLLKLLSENQALRKENNEYQMMALVAKPAMTPDDIQELEQLRQEVAELRNLRNEVDDFKVQNTRLIQENNKYACPTSRLSTPELLAADNVMAPCGECLSCQTRKLSNKLSETEEVLKKATDTHIRLKLEKEKIQELYVNRGTEMMHLNQLNYILENGLSKVLTSSLFHRWEAADIAWDEANHYRTAFAKMTPHNKPIPNP